jgi:hypothetical protein
VLAVLAVLAGRSVQATSSGRASGLQMDKETQGKLTGNHQRMDGRCQAGWNAISEI